MELNTNERKEYIDLMKGIAMIIVIITHTLPLHQSELCIFSTLHNSTFYFASGILFLTTMKKIQAGKTSVRDVLGKKLFRTVYPFFVWMFLYTLTEICILYFSNQPIPALSIIISEAANRLWFLPVLFVGFLINYIIVYARVNKKLAAVIWILAISVTALYSSMASKVLFFSFMIWIGTLCANVHVAAKISLLFIVAYVLVCHFAFLGGGGGYIIISQDFVQPGYKLFLIHIISALGALAMWFMSCLLCHALKGKHISFLTFVGKNSIYFYTIHFASIYFSEYLFEQTILIKVLSFCGAVLIPILYILFLKDTRLNTYLFGEKK